jgi:hypothetical protein
MRSIVEFSAIALKYYDGPCPFMYCGKKALHIHPICPNCGALRFGNYYCKLCRQYRAWKRNNDPRYREF